MLWQHYNCHLWMDQQIPWNVSTLRPASSDVVSIYNMWSSIQVHSNSWVEIHNNLTACCVRSFQDWLWSISMTFGWKGAQRQAVWSIYTDLQSFLGTFPIQKVSILAVEDYSFEDELKLVEIRILVYSDSSPDKMCIFWTHFSAKIAFLPISETLQRKVSRFT